MSKFRKHSGFNIDHHFVYTTLLITPYSFGTQSLWCYLRRRGLVVAMVGRVDEEAVDVGTYWRCDA
jgi:hypothetical protein